jgi:hypothetical protein
MLKKMTKNKIAITLDASQIITLSEPTEGKKHSIWVPKVKLVRQKVE